MICLPPRVRTENKENNTNGFNTVNKSAITHRNRDVIANCLGMETAKILRREKRSNSNSIINLELKKEIDPNTNIAISRNKINEKNINLINEKNLSKRKIEENDGSKSTRNNSKMPENNNNCFIIFNKSNIKKLKKEIHRYDSKNVTIETEPLNSSNIDERKKYLIRPNTEIKSNSFKNYRNKNSDYISNEFFNSSPLAEGNKNDFSQADVSSKNRFLLSSPERNEKIDGLEERKISNFITNLAESKTKVEKGFLIYLYILFNYQMIY